MKPILIASQHYLGKYLLSDRPKNVLIHISFNHRPILNLSTVLLNSTQHENMDAGVRHLYVRISIIKANYETNITL